jgi:putative ABC transport system substrate-binding protein
MTLVRRRTVLAASVGLPFGVRAQQPRGRRVAFLAQIRRPEPFDSHIFGTLARSLRELGWLDGQTMAMDWRFGNGDVSAVPGLAASLLQAQPEVVIVAGTISAVVMRRATTTVPVVFGNVTDPIAAGLVQALARPGTNCTGIASQQAQILPKLFEVVQEAVPSAARYALLVNPKQQAHAGLLPALQASARGRTARIVAHGVTTPAEIEAVFPAMQREGVEVVLVPVEGLFIQQRAQLAEQARRHRMVLAGVDDDLADAGALVTYGADQHGMFRRLATFADRILRGAQPQDLPVELPPAFVLTLNRRVERALQLQLPYALVVRADRIVE